MNNKASVHVTQPGIATGLGDFLRIGRESGRIIPILYGLNANLKDTISRYSPETKLIYRRQSDAFPRLPPGFYENDPVVSATDYLSRTKDKNDKGRTQIQNWALNPADYYDALNEPGLDLPPNPTEAQIQDVIRKAQWLNTWMYTAIDIAAANGFKLALFSFATGNPDPIAWPYLYPCLRKGKFHGAIISLHEYSVEGTMQNPQPGNVLRYREVWNSLPEDCRLPIAITECGSGNGYDTGLSGQDYVDDLMWYNGETCKDEYLIGFCSFQLGGNESNMSSVMDEYAQSVSTFVFEDIPPVLVESPDNTMIPASEKIVDSSLKAWTFGSPVPMGNIILRDGVQFAGGQGNLLLYWGKKVYTRNANNEWYVAGESWSRVAGDPRVSSAPFRLQSPVRGIPFRVTDEFNEPRGYANGKHEGVDLDCYDDINYRSVDILAAADGIVEYIRTTGYSDSGYGKYVVVRHDFPGQVYKTWCCHLSSVSCSVGQSVKTGDKIGVGGSSGTEAIHLHMNLQKIGGGLHGYYVDDVVDPLPYFGAEPPPPSTGLVPIRSVHGRADGGQLRSVDVQAAKVSPLINGYKLYKNSRDDFASLRSNGFKMENVLVRLDHVKDRRVNSEFYINPQGTGIWDLPIKEAMQEGVFWLELFNEPNLGAEGNGVAWSSADDFCGLLKQIILAIRSKYPSAKMLSPAISPQPDTQAWWDAMNRNGIFGLVDGLAGHSYWDSVNGSYPMNSVSGGRHYRGLFRYLTGTKKVHVTEASNNAGIDSDKSKGQQYAEYFKTMEPQVARVDIFCVSSSDVGDGALFNQRRESWVRGTTISPIPSNIFP